MTRAPEIARAAAVPGGAPRPPAAPAGAPPPALARRLSTGLSNVWLPRAAWTVGRTGRPGLVGIALLLASTLFLFSTHLPVAAEVGALREEVIAARERAGTAAPEAVPGPAAPARALPARADMPAILHQLFGGAAQERLSVDTARYELQAKKGSDLVRYQVSFAVTGPYPQIRAFIDATLGTMPEVALSGLALERKAIGDGNVEAQVRMTIYTRGDP